MTSFLKTPIIWLSGRAGLHKGPRRLKIGPLADPASSPPSRISWQERTFGRKIKTKFFSFRKSDAASASRSMGTRSASSTSAEPDRELTALFPCLATGTKRLQTMAEVVEMLKVPLSVAARAAGIEKPVEGMREPDGALQQRLGRACDLFFRLSLFREEDEHFLDLCLLHATVEHRVEDRARLLERQVDPSAFSFSMRSIDIPPEVFYEPHPVRGRVGFGMKLKAEDRLLPDALSP